MRQKKKRKKRLVSSLLLLLLITILSLVALLFKDQLIEQAQQLIPQSHQVNKKATKTVKAKTKKEKQKTVTWTKKEQPVKIPILMYHAVHVMAPEEAANANLIVDPQTFESQIKALKEDGYYFLSPEEAYRVLTKNEVPAEKVVWLTFDDSMKDFYTTAYPILKKYQAKATNNVITGFTQENRPSNLTVAEMMEMKKKGMSFQDHTVNHPDLEMSDPATQESEMKDSMDYLNQNLKQETMAIAYPAGRYSDTTLELAKSLNYKLGVTTNEGLASATDGLLSLNRVRIMPNTQALDLLTYIQTN